MSDESELRSMDNDICRLENENDQLSETISSQQQELTTLRTQVESLSREREQLENRVKELEEETVADATDSLLLRAGVVEAVKALECAAVFELYDSETQKRFPFSESLAYHDAMDKLRPLVTMSAASREARESESCGNVEIVVPTPPVTPKEKQRPVWYDEYKNEPSTDSEPSQWIRSHNPYNGP